MLDTGDQFMQQQSDVFASLAHRRHLDREDIEPVEEITTELAAEDRLVECHGSIHHLQCLRGSCAGIRSADAFQLHVDEATFRARAPLPRCPGCTGRYRPNVLMFGDFGWNPARTEAQEARLEAWLAGLGGAKLAIIECGAGTGVPTVRHFSEQVARQREATLVRLNVREPEVPEGQIGIAMGALRALREIDGLLA